MNKTIMASLAVLVLVIGIGSHVFHPAEAKGVPKCWLNGDGSVKTTYLKYLKSTSTDTKYPVPYLKTFCNKQTKVQK